VGDERGRSTDQFWEGRECAIVNLEQSIGRNPYRKESDLFGDEGIGSQIFEGYHAWAPIRRGKLIATVKKSRPCVRDIRLYE